MKGQYCLSLEQNFWYQETPLIASCLSQTPVGSGHVSITKVQQDCGAGQYWSVLVLKGLDDVMPQRECEGTVVKVSAFRVTAAEELASDRPAGGSVSFCSSCSCVTSVSYTVV